MKQDERKRKFNEAIVNMLYPSPPSSPPQLENEPLINGSTSDVISGTLDDNDNDNASTSGEEEQSCETVKLTRAQRKTIRKKKLREEALRRGKLIGPMLPLPHATTEDQCAPPVRLNASEQDIGLGDETASASSNKMKRRRMAKRLAKQNQIASTPENCTQSSCTSSVAVHNETHM